MVSGVLLEHEWLVPKLPLGNEGNISWAGKAMVQGPVLSRIAPGQRLDPFRVVVAVQAAENSLTKSPQKR